MCGMFVDTRGLGFVGALESRWEAIRAEYLALSDDAFEPWVQREMYGTGWNVYGLWAFGERIEGALAECPNTAKALSEVPGLSTAGFSRLHAGAEIAPHVGWVKTVYRAHLGLVVPDDCAIRVGDETRVWAEGRCLVFDDTVEHEAWNRSGETRAVLLFDFSRPGMEHLPLDEPPPEVREMVIRSRR